MDKSIKAQIGQNVDQQNLFIFLLINKNVIQNFIDQQNLQNGEPPKCWSTKFPPQILLINKISTSHFVEQQNVQFHYQLLQGGTAPPRERCPNFWETFLNPKL